MAVHASHTPSATPSTALQACARDLILVSTATNTLIVTRARTANKKAHGRMRPSATRLTLISSSAQTHSNADPPHTAGMCPKKTGRKM